MKKLAKIVYLLTLGIALSLTSTGCKRLQKTTHIPGQQPRPIGEQAAGARGPGDGSPLGTPPINATQSTPTTSPLVNPDGQGIGATTTDWSNHKQNREIFKEQTVYFDFDQAIVKASEIPKLEEVARRMKTEFAGGGRGLRIEGHCDERGTEDYNRALGDRRALSIREKLAEFGVDPNIMPTVSFGEEQPVDPGHTEAAFKKNRRGELILLTPPGAN